MLDGIKGKDRDRKVERKLPYPLISMCYKLPPRKVLNGIRRLYRRIFKKGKGALPVIQVSTALIMNPSKHGVVNSPRILFDGINEILDNSIILHLALPLCQIGIHVITSNEIILVVDAVLF